MMVVHLRHVRPLSVYRSLSCVRFYDIRHSFVSCDLVLGVCCRYIWPGWTEGGKGACVSVRLWGFLIHVHVYGCGI